MRISNRRWRRFVAVVATLRADSLIAGSWSNSIVDDGGSTTYSLGGSLEPEFRADLCVLSRTLRFQSGLRLKGTVVQTVRRSNAEILHLSTKHVSRYR